MEYPSRPKGLHLLGTFYHHGNYIVAIPVRFNCTSPLVWTGSVKGKSCDVKLVDTRAVSPQLQQHIKDMWAHRGGATSVLLVSMSASSSVISWVAVPDEHIELSARAQNLKDGQTTPELVYQSTAPSYGSAVSWVNCAQPSEKPKRAARKNTSTTKTSGKATNERAVRGGHPYAAAVRSARKNSICSPLPAANALLFDPSTIPQHHFAAQQVHPVPQQQFGVAAASALGLREYDPQEDIAQYMATFHQQAPVAPYFAPIAAVEPTIDYYDLAFAAPASDVLYNPALVDVRVPAAHAMPVQPVQSTSSVLDNDYFNANYNANAIDADNIWLEIALTEFGYVDI